MNDQALLVHFNKWLDTYHPEADRTLRNGVFLNSTTRLLFAGFKGSYEYWSALKAKKEQGAA